MEKIKEIIPVEATQLKSRIEGLYSSVMFSAPENMLMWWRELSNILQKEIGKSKLDWHFKIQKIIMES